MAGSISRAIGFLRDVRAEMRKVVWPGYREVQSATLVIVLLSLLLGFFFGVVDLVFSRGLPGMPENSLVWTIALVGVLGLTGYILVVTSKG